MKRFVALVVAIIVIYSIYYDVKFGTIPTVTHASEIKSHIEKPSKQTSPFQIKKVHPGDTVLTVVEELQSGPRSVSINQVITDFQKLNNGIKPEEIQIGQEYKFPLYKNK